MEQVPYEIDERHSAPLIVYVAAIFSGGIVGYDYSSNLQFSPIFGAALGSLVSTCATLTLRHIYKNESGELANILTFIGFFAGVYLGYQFSSMQKNNETDWIFVSLLFGILGSVLGRLSTTAVAFLAFVLLFVSQGPVGTIVRSAFLELG